MIQNNRQEYWLDEAGKKVPYKYVSRLDKKTEVQIGRLLKEAEKLSERLAELKNKMAVFCEETKNAFAEKNQVDTTDWKGNMTLYSFDRSVKLELSANQRIEFDDMSIKACKSLLDDFLAENIDAKNAFIRDIVTDAFSTSRGKLDTRKVLALLKYESKVKDAIFQEAMRFLKESIRNVGSRNYYRISTKNDNGDYEAVKLQFSEI